MDNTEYFGHLGVAKCEREEKKDTEQLIRVTHKHGMQLQLSASRGRHNIQNGRSESGMSRKETS